MNEFDYYREARNYLLSFESITNEVLEKQINEWKHRKPKSMPKLFAAFLIHAQNRQGMPNSIGDISKLSPILHEFNHKKTLEQYRDWGTLFDAIAASDVKPPGRMLKSNNKSHWVVYCKSIISIAEFLSSYNEMSDFEEFVSGFLTNEQSKLALPLLLSEEIFGFGFALACDFLKENVSPQFLKPDTHLNDIAIGLEITHSRSDYKIFKDMEAYCARIGVLPYEVDKVFWLIGSGNFYSSGIQINSSKHDFIKKIHAIKAKIA